MISRRYLNASSRSAQKMLEQRHGGLPFPLGQYVGDGALHAELAPWSAHRTPCEAELTAFLLFYSAFLYSKHNRKKLAFEAFLQMVSIGACRDRDHAVQQKEFPYRD